MFFCEHCKKYWNFTQSPSVEIFRKRAIHSKICGHCPPTESLHNSKSEEIPVLYAVEATFDIIYLSLLFSAGLNFSIKHVSYDSLKIFLTSRIAKNGMILKFPPSHVLIRPSASIWCNSSCPKCCL